MEAIEPEELMPAVEQHVRDILMDLVCWNRGDYELVMRTRAGAATDNVVALNISTENLILEGIRRCRSWSQILRGIGATSSRVPVPTGDTDVLYKLDLSSEEQEVLAQVNGRSTIEQICQVSYLSNFETCRILWALLVLGVIRREKAGETRGGGRGPPASARASWTWRTSSRGSTRCSAASIPSWRPGSRGAWTSSWTRPWSRSPGSTASSSTGSTCGPTAGWTTSRCWPTSPTCPPEQRKSLMVSGLNELVFVIQLAVRTRYGAQEAAVVSGIIKEGFRKLGVA